MVTQIPPQGLVVKLVELTLDRVRGDTVSLTYKCSEELRRDLQGHYHYDIWATDIGRNR